MKSKQFAHAALLGLSLASCLFSTGTVSAAEEKKEAESPLEAVTGGKLLLNLRPRYEYVDLATKPENAKAFTLRSPHASPASNATDQEHPSAQRTTSSRPWLVSALGTL